MATEAQLLTDIATVYDKVDPAPTVMEEEDAKEVTRMRVNVFEVGKSAGENKPIAYRKTVEYYVYKRGKTGEKAFYAVDEPRNTSDKTSQVSNGSLEGYYRIFTNEKLRARVLGTLLKKSAAFIAAGTPGADLTWARDNIKAPAKYMDPFMSLLSADTQVRADGAAITDANLETAVGAVLPAVEAAFSLS